MNFRELNQPGSHLSVLVLAVIVIGLVVLTKVQISEGLLAHVGSPGDCNTINSDAEEGRCREGIPNFGTASTNQAPTTSSVQNGLWSNPSTWDNGVPGPNDSVHIDHNVTYDITSSNPKSSELIEVVRVEVGGKLTFDRGSGAGDTPLKLTIDTFFIMGELEIGTEASPMLRDVEVVFDGVAVAWAY
jgi:hypothetical protein